MTDEYLRGLKDAAEIANEVNMKRPFYDWDNLSLENQCDCAYSAGIGFGSAEIGRRIEKLANQHGGTTI